MSPCKRTKNQYQGTADSQSKRQIIAEHRLIIPEPKADKNLIMTKEPSKRKQTPQEIGHPVRHPTQTLPDTSPQNPTQNHIHGKPV